MEQNIERLYRIWNGIKQRCLNPKNPSFKNYGARGIVICEEWKLSRDKFVIWALSHGYSDELSLDRIDGNSGYSPDNCRWVNQTIQSNNRRHYWLPKNTPDFVYDDVPNDKTENALRESIKKRLSEHSLTQVWLINRLEEVGIMTDKSELSSTLSGTRKGAKTEALLKYADEILSKYEETMLATEDT